jgi:hypothetical protein
MGTALFWKWSAPGMALCFLALAVITHVSVARKQKEIIQRAKTAGVGLSEEETKRIKDLDAERDKMFRIVIMGVVAMCLFTMLDWGSKA